MRSTHRPTVIVAVALVATLAASGCARRRQTAAQIQTPPAPEAAAPVAGAAPTPAPAAPAPAPRAAAPTAPAPTPAPVAEAPSPAAPAPVVERRSRLDPIYFDFDRSEIKLESRNVIETNANWLRQNPVARIQIEGHCDERGSVQYNLALGERRAESTRRYLESLGVDASRLSTISYGKERPVDPGHTEEAWAKNRRAEFVVTAQ